MSLRFTTQIGKITLLAIMLLPSFAMAHSKPTIDYQIMVQRATQAAIWVMPAAGIIDIEKATQRI
jgi:hypothetical protein